MRKRDSRELLDTLSDFPNFGVEFLSFGFSCSNLPKAFRRNVELRYPDSNQHRANYRPLICAHSSFGNLPGFEKEVLFLPYLSS